MEKVAQIPEKKLKEQLAAAVENLQWSYAIFWSSSITQPKVLSWCNGYYNGDIKTRKITNQLATEFKEEVPGLQRNEQLRELYEYLSTDNNDNSQQTRRPSTSLSPEDLTSTEWYYLVCMSFTFGQGEGLPGRVLESNRYAWVSGAQFVERKTFSRSILAKSASIQTVVCIPVLDGVLEFGTTKFVLEDPNLIQQIMEMFWERPCQVYSEHSSSNSWIVEKDELEENLDNIFNDALQNPLTLDKHDFNHDNMAPFSFDFPFRLNKNNEQMQEIQIASSNSSSFNGSFKISILNDCIQSENLENLVDSNRYKKTLSAILKNSKGLNSSSGFPIGSRSSSFTTWRRNLSVNNKVGRVSQKMLKKILIYSSWFTEECDRRNKASKQEKENVGISHVLSERRRREKLNENFLVLRSLLPSMCKVDKASILDYAIEYLKELEKRVTELESCKNTVEVQARERQNKTKRTSDNFRNNLNKNANKRKACDMVESEGACIDVNVIEKEVMIELKCTWRDSLLLEIFNVIDELELETQSVLSSNVNGILALTLKAKCRNSTIVSPGTVEVALCSITGKH
uniref:BHLH transcription factor n=1 Tax=Allium cepa TaxID=4679 RepID=A0A5P9Q3E6_ALLCE|nr:bHLH transcription factor [Allium cepa]